MSKIEVNYEVVPEYVEHNRITIKNPYHRPALYRVDVNHRLTKLVYIEPHSSKSFIHQGEIKDLQIKELT